MLVQRIYGILSACNMQIRNSTLCESSKCWLYSAINHHWWRSKLFHRQVVRLYVTFGGSGVIMTTARPELPYPCVSQAKTRGESSRSWKQCDGIASLGRISWGNVFAASWVLAICKLETRNFVNRVLTIIYRAVNHPCLRVCQVVFLGVLPFSPNYWLARLILSWNNLERDVKVNKKISKPPMVDEHAFPPTGFSCCRLGCSLSFMVLSTSLGLCFYPPCSCPTGPEIKMNLYMSLTGPITF